MWLRKHLFDFPIFLLLTLFDWSFDRSILHRSLIWAFNLHGAFFDALVLMLLIKFVAIAALEGASPALFLKL